jgi:hypothetical protein
MRKARLTDHNPGEEAIPSFESNDFLQKYFATPILHELYNVSHMLASKLSCNIDALHVHILKGFYSSSDRRLLIVLGDLAM